MKKIAYIAFILMLPLPALGQYVTITGTVQDPNGCPYTNGTGVAVLVPTNTSYFYNQTNPARTPVVITKLDSFGNFSIQLNETDLLTPTSPPPQWQFSFSSSQIVSPVNIGSISFTMSPMTLNSSQDISATIKSQAAIFPGNCGGGSIVTPVSLSNGGTATSTPCSTTNALFYFTGTAFGCDSGITTDTLGGLTAVQVKAGAISITGSGTGVISMLSGIAPSPPASGYCSVYIDSGSGLFSGKNHSGGSCINGVAGAVLLSPPGLQQIIQPLSSSVTTALELNNFNNIRYAQQFNWSQSPSGSISAGSNTVTLTPCPAGINTTNNANAPYYVYIATTGTPEAAAVTGGSCIAGAASGTITFTTINSHAAGFSIGSSSSGIVEAVNDAAGIAATGNPNALIWIGPTGANTNALPIYAPMYIVASKFTLIGDGAHLQCQTRSSCLHLGDTASVNDATILRVLGLRFETTLNAPGVHVTNVALTSNVLTVTTDASHGFSTTANAGAGDEVWAEIYAPTFSFAGMLTVASTPSGTTYTAPFTHANVSSVAAFGWTVLENAAIEDNALNTDFRNISLRPVGSTHFSYFFVLDNDQAAKIDDFDTDGGGTTCTSSFCGAIVLQRGDHGNSGLFALNYSNLNLQCNGNGTVNWTGNSQSINDTVIEGFSQYGIRYVAGLQNEFISNVYEEVGGCTNPYYTGSLQAQAGVIHQGQNLFLRGGSEASQPLGNFPQFANTGATIYHYYIVPHSTSGVGPVFLAGTALTNGSGNILVQWPCLTGVGDSSDTYDVLRTSGTSPFIPPYAGQTASISIATANSGTPTNGMCSFTDTNASASSYTVPAQTTYSGYWFWPGDVVLTLETYANVTWGPSLYTDQQPNGIVSGAGTAVASVFSTSCNYDPSTYSPFLANCIGSPALGTQTVISTIFSQRTDSGGSPVANSKGRVNFGNELSNLPNHIVTWVDSNFEKTKGTPGNRPGNDANDCFTGEDQTGGLSIGCKTSLSRYIGNVGDGTSWLERLTATSDAWTVPIKAPNYQSSSNCAATGSAANPSVAACGSALAGSFSCATNASTGTCVVDTTAVTANSEIFITQRSDTTTGTRLGVTCNATLSTTITEVTAVTAGTSFTINLGTITTNPECFSYFIVN